MKNQLPYFAYGSNLDLDDLKTWCKKSGATFPVDGASGVEAVLPDHTLLFNVYYSGRNGGVLNIHRCPGQAVPGVLYDVLPKGLDSLDRKEGVPVYYDRKIVTVFTENGTAVQAVTYEVLPEKAADGFVLPSEEYVNIVLKGLEDFDLDNRMLKAVADNNRAPWMIDNVFVYGTLMKGECREHALDFGTNIISVHQAETTGLLYNLGDYPGLVISDNCSGTVTGELYQLKDMGKSLSILDKIEGFYGFDQERSLYIRTALKIKDHSGNAVWAWTYVINSNTSIDDIIESGDWRTRNTARE